MTAQRCGNCRFGDPREGHKYVLGKWPWQHRYETVEYRICMRFPQTVEKPMVGWCGEWKEERNDET